MNLIYQCVQQAGREGGRGIGCGLQPRALTICWFVRGATARIRRARRDNWKIRVSSCEAFFCAT